MCSVGGAGRAELDCSVLEEDWQTGQSYMAHWHSVALVPPHRHGPTVTEAERTEKHCEARRLLQRFLSGAISKDHPKARPHQPINDQETKLQRGPGQVKTEVCCVTMRPKSERKTVMTNLPRFMG